MARLVIDRNGEEERRNTRKVEIVFEEKSKIYFKEGIFGMDSFIFWKFEKDQRASERALRLCVGWREGPGDFVAWRSRRTEVRL